MHPPAEVQEAMHTCLLHGSCPSMGMQRKHQGCGAVQQALTVRILLQPLKRRCTGPTNPTLGKQTLLSDSSW